MVLIAAGRECREDGRIDLRDLLGEHRLVAEVHQRLVGVVVEEHLAVLRQAHRIVDVVGVGDLVLVELEQKVHRVVLELLLALLGLRLQTLLVLVSDVVAVHSLITDDQTDEVSGVRQFRMSRPVHGQVEAGVEEEGLEQRRSDFALERIVTPVVAEDDVSLLLEVGVLTRPAESLVDLLRRAQRREDRGVRLRVHALHERDVRQDRLFVRSHGIRDERDRTDGALDRVEQSQAGEDTHRQRLLIIGQRRPGLDVVAQRNLLRQPEVAGQAVPDLVIDRIDDAVPVDGVDMRCQSQILQRFLSSQSAVRREYELSARQTKVICAGPAGGVGPA